VEIGIDVVDISRTMSALERWGRTYAQRVIGDDKFGVADWPTGLQVAVALAVKEAAIKCAGARPPGGLRTIVIEDVDPDREGRVEGLVTALEAMGLEVRARGTALCCLPTLPGGGVSIPAAWVADDTDVVALAGTA